MPDRILVVEDSRPMREVTVDFLQDEGYDCDAASTGTEGLALIEANEYDVILTDLRLPGADGLSIVEAANRAQPQTPKIIMTAYSEVEDTLRALRLGAYDFIQKPIRNMWELGIIIQRAAEHRKLLLERKNHLAEIESVNKRLEEEVSRRTEELIVANRELRTLDEMKNNLLANVSHELRTPLVSVRGYTELFQSGRLCPIPEDCRKYFDTCLRNIDRLLTLIESLVAYADLAREGVELALEVVDLTEMAKALLAKSQKKATEIGITFTTSTLDEPILVNADRTRLENALHQIIDNALKFTPADGTVCLTIGLIGKHLAKITIKDSGIGIPLEEQGLIFERFYQVDSSSTRRHGGTGMGLAIARDNLRLLGCELRVSSEPDHGSTFFFTLPIVKKEKG